MEVFQNMSVVIISVLIILETIIRFKNGIDPLEKKDLVVSMSLGLTSLSISLSMKAFFLNVFDNVSLHNLFEISLSPSQLMMLFILNDFGSYWYHRLAHCSRFFWASHIVHHSSPSFNLSVGIRESILEGVYRFCYWSMYCLMGFPAVAVFMVDGINLIFQVLLHTRFIGKLGFLEFIINTPSSHRVHHSSNPEYLNKNFGGVLIIWDRIFGTYRKEKSEPVYGVAGEITSYNLLTIHLSHWKTIASKVRRSRSIPQIIISVFGKPDM